MYKQCFIDVSSRPNVTVVTSKINFCRLKEKDTTYKSEISQMTEQMVT